MRLSVGNEVVLLSGSGKERVSNRVNFSPVDYIFVQKIKAQLLPLIFIFLLAVLAGLPLLQGKLLKSHDSLFYPPRTTAFYAGLAEGKILPRWTQGFAGGYGEPFFNFNAPLLYYLNSFFQLFGFGQINALNFSLFALLLAAGLAMYFLASEFFGRAGGVVAATAYLFAPYTLLDLYVRGSYAEFSGMPFIPLTLWLFYKAEQTERSQYFLFGAIAFALMLLTNNTISLMVTPILGLLICINAVHKKSVRPLLRSAAFLMLGLMLAAFFWLPSLLENKFVHTDNLLKGDLNYQSHFIYFQQLLYSPWGYGTSVQGVGDGMSFQIGYAHLALSLTALFVFFKPFKIDADRQRVWIDYFLLVILIGIFFSTETSLFVWQQVKLLQYLQFPWRFLILVSAATSFLCGAVCLLIRKNSRLAKIAPVICIAAILLFNYSHTQPQGYLTETDEVFSINNIINNRLEAALVKEFRPKWVSEDARNSAFPLLVVTDTGAQSVETFSSSTEHKFHLEGERESLVRLNIHYFPGWKVFIDGTESEIDYTNRYGLIHFAVPAGSHDIQAKFFNTPIRTASEIISVTGIILLVLTWLVLKKMRWSKSPDTTSESQT
jgi:hypothetical protein